MKTTDTRTVTQAELFNQDSIVQMEHKWQIVVKGYYPIGTLIETQWGKRPVIGYCPKPALVKVSEEPYGV